MKRYKLFHPFFMSFYSKDLYRDVAKYWKAETFLYLFILLAICWIPDIIKMHLEANDYLTNKAPGIVKQIPELTIVSGELSTPEQKPYFITNPENDSLFAVIDITGEITSLDDTDADILITKNKFMMRKSASEWRVYDLSNIDELHITEDNINNWIEILKKWFSVFIYIIVLLATFAYRIIQALLYALFGLIFSKFLHISLDYEVLLRLSVIAITPVIILETVRSGFDISVPYWGFICFLTAMGYLFFAVKANAGPEITDEA